VTVLAVATTTVDIEVNPGEPLEVSFPMYDGDGEPVEVASGAAGWSGAAQVRADWRATTTLHELDVAFTEGTPGSVVISATAVETAGWQAAGWTAGEYDLYVTDTTSVPHCLVAGQIQLRPRVTREDV
jgi:hypothetical protein